MKSRIGYIDGLRAIAVLSVVLHHAAKYNHNLNAGPLQHGLLEGAHGVDLFFVISGFCLSYPTLARLRASHTAIFDVVHYASRRIIRIIPPYYAAIGVCGLLLLLANSSKWQLGEGMAGTNINGLEILKQMLFLDWHPQFVNGSFWSLAVEFRWYFVFPLMLLLWTRSPRAFGLIAFAAFLTANFTRAGGFDLAILPAFMLGIVAADVELRRINFGRTAVLAFLLAVCTALALEPRDNAEFFRQNQLAWQVSAFFLVVASGCAPTLRALLSARPLVLIGLGSYSIYLIHEPVIGLIERNTHWGSAIAIGLSIGCGLAFWLIFERPFVQTHLKSELINILQPKLAWAAEHFKIPALVTLDTVTSAKLVRTTTTITLDSRNRPPSELTVDR